MNEAGTAEPSAMHIILRIRQTGLKALTGTDDFRSLVIFLQGVGHGLNLLQVRDSRYAEFLTHLRRTGRAPPAGGWTKFFLDACGGDGEAALVRFLEAAEEFMRSD